MFTGLSGETLFVDPSDVGFTQCSISPTFQDGRKLLDVVLQLARSDIQKRTIPMMNVVRHDDGWLYSLDNRRLAVFRLLKMAGCVYRIKVRVVSKPQHEWRRKFDTRTEGAQVRVRTIDRWIGMGEADTTFDWSELKRLVAAGADEVFYVDTCLSGLDSDDEEPFDPDEFAIGNISSRAQYCFDVIWEGAHKTVCEGHYVSGERRGQSCVVKSFKSGDVYNSVAYNMDLKALTEAKRIITAFNRHVRPARPVYINDARVWRRDKDGAALLVEPRIVGTFRHFNSNTGYEADGCMTMAALSHFSFHFSGGRHLLCDLQGGQYHDHYILTDPVIISTTAGIYGPTDLGKRGIEQFFSQHQCSRMCRQDWAWPESCRQHFTVVRGSTLILNRRILYGSR